MMYQITSITMLPEPEPLGSRKILAKFTVEIGPVELRSCALAMRDAHGYDILWPSKFVKVPGEIRSEIKARVKAAYPASAS